MIDYKLTARLLSSPKCNDDIRSVIANYVDAENKITRLDRELEDAWKAIRILEAENRILKLYPE